VKLRTNKKLSTTYLRYELLARRKRVTALDGLGRGNCA